MDSKHLIDPELIPVLADFPTVTLTAENLVELRALAPPPIEPDDGITVEELVIDGPADSPNIAIQLIRPVAAPDPLPTIYHVHGGGFVSGSPRHSEASNRALVSELGCALVSVDYRLAPETIFPGAVEDCYAGLAWTFDNAGDRGFDVQRIGIMGESAGGGLAAALCLIARDRNRYRPAFQHLVYPMIDDRTCTLADPHPFAGEFMWHVESNRFGWTSLLGHPPGGEGVSPYAAAARATNLSRLPPAFISTGSIDLFLEENMEYARRLSRAGVQIEFHVFPGGFHAYDTLGASQIGEETYRVRLSALRRALWPVSSAADEPATLS